ncbi:MAG TPA: AsmA-like C-terminal region-containing protein [Saprospiraceae bacterium]|nr:AsmA-like C-terminal region-containing protein [Saprospiraceae bacterium]
MIKSIVKWLSLFFLVLLLAAVLVPLLYKKEIQNKIKTEANKQINGTLEFKDVDLSFFTHFPKLTVSLNNIELRSFATVDSSILFSAKKCSVSLPFWSLFELDKGFTIQSFDLDGALINIISTKEGQANYNITKSDSSSASNSNSNLNLKLQKYSFTNCEINYIDRSADGMIIQLKNLNHTGKGDFNNKIFALTTQTKIDSLTAILGGIKYLNRVKLNSTLDLEIDQLNSIYKIKENKFALNELQLAATGEVQMNPDESIKIQMEINNPGNQFKDVFSLLPYAYTKDFAAVKSSGDFSLNGKINGLFDSKKESYPDWNFLLKINNGNIQYPNMPVSLKDLNLDLKSINKGPSKKYHSINIKPLHFILNRNAVDGFLSMDQLEQDPHISGQLKGAFSLQDYKQLIPIDPNVKLEGLIKMDLDFDATQSQVTTAQYNSIKCTGFAEIQQLQYADPTMPLVAIPSMTMQFSPQAINLNSSQLKLGKSDLELKGKINNPLALLYDQQTTEAQLELQSHYFDGNEWLTASEGSTVTSEPTQSSSVLPLAKKLKVNCNAKMNDVRYDTYIVKDVLANMTYDNDVLSIQSGQATVNQNQLKIDGQLNRLLGFGLQNELLEGTLNIKAQQFDLSKFFTGGDATRITNTSTTTEEPFLVPEGMKMDINFVIDQFQYDKLKLNQFKGLLNIANEMIEMHDMSSQTMGGSMIFNGVYNSQNHEKPSFDIKYEIQKFQFPKAFESILTFQKLAPVAQFVEGVFNSTFVANGSLGKNMMPDLNTINIGGLIETINAAVKGFKPIEGLADKLNIAELKTISLENTKNWFTVENGTVTLKEIKKTMKDIDMTLQGTHKISGPMDYQFKFRIPRSKFNQNPVGSTAEKGLDYLKNMGSKVGINIDNGTHVNVAVTMSGPMKDPKFNVKLLGADGESLESSGKTLLQEAGKKAEDSLRTIAQKELDKAKQKAMEQAQRAEDSLRSIAKQKAEEAKNKVLDQAGKELEKHVDSNLVKKGKEVLNDQLGKEAGKVLNEDAKKEMEKAKEKLKNWDPFKKKGG